MSFTPAPKPSVKAKIAKVLKRSGLKGVRKSPYQHPEVQALFRKVRVRSSGWCEQCQSRTATAVHHLAYLETGVRGWRRLLVPLSDLIHLCKVCHSQAHPENMELRP